MQVPITTYTSRIQRFRLPRICVAVIGSDGADLLDRAESLVRHNPFLEFRLDYLAQPAAALPRIKHFLDLHPEATVVATCRRAINGGKFKGSLPAQLDILVKAAAAGCQLVDLEIQSAQELKPSQISDLKAKVGVILSYHDFKVTRKLAERFTEMVEIPADFYKMVTTAASLYDNVTMMKFLQANSGKHDMVALCMGEQGIISRVLGVRAGSVFTFGSAARGEETAPGQVTASELRDTYRIDTVEASTQVYGVAGDPISHSLSPIMMNAAFRRETVNAVFLALQAKSLKDLLACVNDIPIRGMSITMPFKEEIVAALANSDPLTRQIGACNTVVRGQDGKLYGFNTDVAGIVVPLEQRMNLNGKRVLVMGAGGAARAAVFGLKSRNAEVFVSNRTPERAQALARQAKAKYLKRADLAKSSFDVIINATSVGMNDPKHSPLEDKELNAQYVFDLIYVPAETKLLKMAKAKGLQTIAGLEMFVQQGARQFEIWTGKPSPIAEMGYVVSKALERQRVEAGEAEPEKIETAAEVIKETPAKKSVRSAAKAPAKSKSAKATKSTTKAPLKVALKKAVRR
jgi:3-dehydroquinate dehydratase/shikimate dehydrogenase